MVTRKMGVIAVAVLFAFTLIGIGYHKAFAGEQKGAGDFLLDAALGAGEGAIVGKASGGKAGKGALIGAGTGLAREAIIKPMLQGGMQPAVRTTVPPSPSPEVYEQRGVDPYQMGFEEGFKKGYEQGFKSGLEASRSR